MKRYLKYILPAILMLGLSACQEEELWQPGEMDPETCQGVYFPQVENPNFVFDPENIQPLTFAVHRDELMAKKKAEVPYELEVSEEGIFELKEDTFVFDKDQSEASFTVYVSDKCELGKKYTCTIRVTDPEYVSTYSLTSAEITFSVKVVGWEYVGKGLWRDDFFCGYATAIGATLAEPHYEKEVHIYERADLAGYYKIDSVYTGSFLAYMAEGSLDDAAEYAPFGIGEAIYLNAVNPEKVYFELQFAFSDPAAKYGYIYMVSDVDEEMGAGYSSNLYGKNKNGCITFPKNAVYAFLPSVNNGQGGMAYANTDGKLRIVLPGSSPVDYSISLSNSFSENGVMPIEFSFSSDVKEVKYQVYNGHLNDVEMVSKLEEVKSGNNVRLLHKPGVYDFTFEKSDFYTLIACTFDAAGNYQEYEVIKFGYDTAKDPREVKLNLGLIVSDKFSGKGLTSENSMEFYIYGSDIVKASAAVFRTSQYADFKETIDQNVQNAYALALTQAQVDSVNTVGYTGVFGGLNPGVEYSLIVYADNGYHNGIFSVSKSTEGEFDIFAIDYDIFDIPERLQPETHDAYLRKDWQIMSFNIHTSKDWLRAKAGTASIVDGEDVMFRADGKPTVDPDKAVETVDYLHLKGMHPTLAAKGLNDVIDLRFYEGFVYTLMTEMDAFKYNDKQVYPTNAYLYIMDQLYFYTEPYAMVGGFITEDQDVIAFMNNPSNEIGSYGGSYFAMQLGYVEDKNSYSDLNAYQLFEEDVHAYPMLVAKDSKYLAKKPAETPKPSTLSASNAVTLELQKGRRNMVETNDGYVKSTIDMVRTGMPRNYMEHYTATDIVRDMPAAEFTVASSSKTAIEKNLSKEVKFLNRTILK